MIDTFEVLDSGLMYCSVCTNITDRKRIEELVNAEVLQTLDKPWKLCSEVVLNDEVSIKKSLNMSDFSVAPPMLCTLIPYTHKHYTLQCYGGEHQYSKLPEPKTFYKYTPRVVVQEAPVVVKEKERHTPLERRELNGVSFLETTNRGKTNLKLDSLFSSKDEFIQRRRALRKIDKKVKVIVKDKVFAVYIVL